MKKPLKKSFFRRTTCRLCSGKKLDSVIKLAPMPIGDAYVDAEHLGEKQETFPIEVFLCRTCGHAQLLDVVDPEKIYRKYIYHTSDSLGLVEHFRKGVGSILEHAKPQKGSLVIDIGSNDGSVLRCFKEQGMKVLGIDPAKEIARKATGSGIETLPELFNSKLANEVKKKYGSAKIIVSNNTFANIDDLDEMANGIKKLLAPDGVFVVETGYVLDLLQKMIFDNIYHEHLSYFSAKPLKTFFARKGMELINVERVATKGGSLRLTVQLAGGPRKESEQVEKLIRLETDLGLHEPQIFKNFETNFNSIKSQTVTLLKSFKAKGRKIIGYGASVGVTTVLYNFGIGTELLDCLVDDNPGRQGLYSPGFRIPVKSPGEIYGKNATGKMNAKNANDAKDAKNAKKPDYVIILAWQYSEPIIRKNQEYVNQGGYFIDFLPLLKITGKSDI